MKQRIVFFFFLFAFSLAAQIIYIQVQSTTADPSGSCNPRSYLVFNRSTAHLLGCNGTWRLLAVGSSSPGTVTSVAFSTNLGTVTGSPVTGSGTLTDTVSAAQVVGLFSGCSGVLYLGADGACHAAGAGSVITISGSGPAWLTWNIATPTTTPVITLTATTGQTSHQVIGTCNALTTFAPCSLVASDLPTLSTTVNGTTCTIGSTCTVTGAPSGTAGGDLSGTYPNPTVAKVNGNTPGGTCTNQVTRSIDSSGRPTCATVQNADMANVATTVNGQTCTLGSTCTVTAAPTGTAGGDLSGTYPNPTVAKVNGNTPGNTCTNQFERSINSSAVGTCATVSLTADVSGITPVANGGAVAQGSNACGTSDLCASGFLTQAQIVSLTSTNSTWIQVIAAPASGSMLVADQLILESGYNGTVYAGGSNILVDFSGTSQQLTSVCPSGTLTQANKNVCTQNSTNSGQNNVTNYNGLAAKIGVIGAAFTCSGTCGNLYYWIKYRIVTGLQ